MQSSCIRENKTDTLYIRSLYSDFSIFFEISVEIRTYVLSFFALTLIRGLSST
jgi:hypothetical protein